MFRVQIRNQVSGVSVFYSEPVSELHDCHNIYAKMEGEFQTWMEQGFPQLSPDNPIQFLEGSEIYVVSDDGIVYWLNGDTEFEMVN